ncbi:MAG: GTPase [Planctomycetes bacterium]|nr:GTPase [Planctomycetota bacterium]
MNVLILGAAGKDFHTFNCCYRDREDARVVAFTATQIPDIAGRRYPPELAGPRYPEGIEILDEADLATIVVERRVDLAVFAYSDVSDAYVDERRAVVEGAGARFELAPVEGTMLPTTKPVVAVLAVRTGCGKSQTARRVAAILRERGLRVVAIRHPMPYGDLVRQRVQRFATLDDLDAQACTIEEREEYEPHLAAGGVVYAGVDYRAILEQAEREADVILWDGGNNDTSFYVADLTIVVADPLRPGHELTYYPGRINFARADALLLNKLDSATPEGVQTVLANAARVNPGATILRANSALTVADPGLLRAGARVLAVEDGPTCTHGGVTLGAASVAATRAGAELVDPRPYAVGRIAETFAAYPGIGPLLPAMGYGEEQVRDLEATIARVPADAVLIGTPIDLARLVRIEQPHTRVTYELEELGSPTLRDVLARLPV